MAARLVPDRYDNVERLEHVQRVADLLTVRNARFGENPISQAYMMIGWIVRVYVGGTVAGRSQAFDERWFAGTATPAQPTETPRFRAVENVLDHNSWRRIRKRLGRKCDRI